MRMDKEELEELKDMWEYGRSQDFETKFSRERKKKDETASEITNYIWKILLLCPDETVDGKTRDDFEIEIRKML